MMGVRLDLDRMRSNLGWRFALSLCIGWFGTVIPVLMAQIVQNISWGLRLVFPAWIVHGSFAVLLVVWILLLITLLTKIWHQRRPTVTEGHRDQRRAAPRPFPINPRSMITPMATMRIPLKLDTPPKDWDAQQ